MSSEDICTNLSSMNTERKTANAVGGKTARACDSCLCKRARWYCAADDAFLCQGCDSSVHSANQLARRHERVRLGTASFKASESKTVDNFMPTWHQGISRKARTPRHPKSASVQQLKDKERISNTSPLVPEIGSGEASFEENEEQLLYRVPVFDPFAAELCNVSNETKNIHTNDRVETGTIIRNEPTALLSDNGNDEAYDLNNLPVFLPSDMELAEFAADVDSILGTGLDEDSCGIEGLGLIECKEENDIDVCFEGSRVKVEDEEVQAIIACHFDPEFDMSRETLDWNFDYESPVTGEEEEEEKVAAAANTTTMILMNSESKEIPGKKFLRLNYEEVITAWHNRGCPWTTGTRPEFNPDDSWPDFMGMCAAGGDQPYGDAGGRMGGSDGGREARVSRYREKRKTRLFSKKIRYEVRKQNAEKRPRMKGRFVKRTSFAGGPSAFPNYLMNK